MINTDDNYKFSSPDDFFSDTDRQYMTLALTLAKRGMGWTSPNPMVGAVIVKDGEVIGQGYHHRCGMLHAEREALADAKANGNEPLLNGATMFVTLEPCCHTGRTPPCTEAVIESGIRRVVVASEDVDERVAGNGIQTLRNAGIRVDVGLFDEDNRRLNSIFYFYKQYKRPYIVLKAAMTLDGKIATSEMDSSWISNEQSRSIVHDLRGRLKAIAVGKNTVIHDKPRLNCRSDNPALQNKPVDKIIFAEQSDVPTDSFAPNGGRIFFADRSITSSPDDFISFCMQHEIDSVLVEGGSGVYTWFLQNGLADRIILFYRPSFMGADGLNVVGGLGVTKIHQLMNFNIHSVKQLGDNIMIDLSRIGTEALCLLD
ncbi:MAG: bifunctional diaminohydroxyphosphoribosylaminopyrimidine deaminase/5-amino-6-(5-phosphoribosylamino)uracil reductase RibD [Spirochaetales bacterium]|nr:bifunctional diaminohydroxyphosphoribosylaminopyrimidine deaminase/5-amino-6-(5-phosphoribosylamino)uracil reductase RibD [Spirochaetales bacterium]